MAVSIFKNIITLPYTFFPFCYYWEQVFVSIRIQLRLWLAMKVTKYSYAISPYLKKLTPNGFDKHYKDI